MLTQLVELLASEESGMSLAEIGRAMNAQPSALMGMIDLLVRKGKLMEIGPDGRCCGTCELEGQCNLLAARGKKYLVNRGPNVSVAKTCLAEAE